MSAKKFFLYGCLPATVLALGLVGGCTALVGGAANEVDKAVKADDLEDRRALKEDVKIVTCSIVETVIGKELKAKVEITNHGKKRANYLIEGEFLGADGNQVDSLTAVVENLAPGKSSKQDFVGVFMPGQLDGVGKGRCKVLKVSRDEWSAAN